MCKNFGVEDYTEDAEFQCAVSDNDGTLYFGSNYGVFVYKGEKKSNGKSWDIMRLPDPDIVRSLYLDTTYHRLYVGGQNDLGYFQLSSSGKSNYFSLRKYLPTTYEESIETWHIFKQNSELIFHTLAGLLIYHEGKDVQIIPAPQEGMFHNVFRKNDSTLLINSIRNGWFTYTRELAPVSRNTSFAVDKCYSVLKVGKADRFLFFFRNEGVYEAGIINQTFTDIKKVSKPDFDQVLAEGQVYGAMFNNDSTRLIIATLTKGALLVNYSGHLESKNIFSEAQSATDILSVYGLYTDKLKNTWLLGKSNLSLLPSDLSLIHKSFKGITVNGLALSHNKLYITAINGLYTLDLQDKLFSHTQKLLDGPFNKIIQIGDTIYTFTTNKIIRITNEKLSVHSSPFPIKGIASVNNTLWIYGDDGIATSPLSPAKQMQIGQLKNIMQVLQVGPNIYALVRDAGLFNLTTEGKIISKAALNHNFPSTRNARLFNAGGILLISNLRNTYQLKNQIIVVADTTKLWMFKNCSNGNQIKFEYDNSDITSLKIKERGHPDFVNANSFMSPVDVNDAEYYQGYYYLATKNGLCVSRLLADKPSESVKIIKLMADSIEYLHAEHIRIPYEKSSTINVFCSLHSFYSSFDNTQYSYRLSNYSKDWTAQAWSNFTFNNLRWGSYKLEVRVNYGNDQVSQTSVLHFVIERPWWATPWAIGFWFAMFVLFIYIIVQISIFRLKQSKLRLEKIVRDRTVEIVKQKDEIAFQKEEIENKNHEITDSLNYAQRIQSSLLKGEDKLRSFCSEAFVIYIPKDIVSGDFYWFTEVMGHKVIAVADCTGHGVPGAFMSMLGVAKLNDLAVKNIYLPHELLRELNHLIVETLGQKTLDADSRDGMDIAIITINKTNGKLYYAGANRPLFIVDRKARTTAEIKATKLPVGGGQYDENRNYQLHEIDINQDISIFLSTDGYADQFGGDKGKKFRTDRLQDLLVEVASKTASEQKNILEQNYKKWKGSLDQVDDVCLVGINFTAEMSRSREFPENSSATSLSSHL